ncbi:hypothetical protein F5883DRAFT_50244 [Diaporthe sp. PMI_573]|nr:hypothetical protein F5883DRAFT_50244 [Diaporthaceae sp. PMI_573]
MAHQDNNGDIVRIPPLITNNLNGIPEGRREEYGELNILIGRSLRQYCGPTESSKTVHKWWLQNLTAVIGVSTLGASITFGVLTTFSATPETLSGQFDNNTIQTFLAVAFLLFLVTIGVANLLYLLIFFYEDDFFRSNEVFGQSPNWLGINYPFKQWLHWSNLILTSVMLAAFIMLALVIVGYVKVVGWITLACIGVYCILYLAIWLCKLFS